jgi:hypothetical protein
MTVAPHPSRQRDRETGLLMQIGVCASLLCFAYFLQHGDILLYGDAVAHINIARRVFDSRTPGLLQLGTVWLPLPHLLMIPFLLSNKAWQTGIGGSVPSMLAYVAATVGIFRLLRGAFSFPKGPTSFARFAAWLGAGIYAANPNLIYMQSTAMTESLYLAFFIWAVVHFGEFVQSSGATQKNSNIAGSSLTKCGLCLIGACLTRYDGWFLAGALCLAAAVVVIKARSPAGTLGRVFGKFVLLAAAAPALWLAYNTAVYQNPLEFANGPYSAQAIEQRTTTFGKTPHPGWQNLPIAFSYFLKAGEDNVADGKIQKLWLAAPLIGSIIVVWFERRCWPLLLLLIPVPFYTLSIAYGSVPVFIPDWWPFSYYNVRFGLELLPAFAAMIAVTIYFLLRFSQNHAAKVAIVLVIAMVSASYVSIWKAQPICFREASTNSRSRIALETELASTLSVLPQNSTFLMYLGDHVGALQRAGISLRRTINEGDHRPWKRPSDPEGLWERALADPQKYADFVIAFDEDPVAKAVRGKGLTSIQVIHAYGQPAATIYWTRPNQH